MPISMQTEEFWRDEWSVSQEDEIELQEYFIQQGRPLTLDEISLTFVRSFVEQSIPDTQDADGNYVPTGNYVVGEKLTFPALDYRVGEVVGIRDGQNERYGPFRVIQVRFARGQGEDKREFAAEMASAAQLGGPDELPFMTPEELYEQYGVYIRNEVEAALEASDNFVSFGPEWLPVVMLVHFHEGHCNLADAMIDITSEPMKTGELLTEMPLEEEASEAVKRFSLNRALSEDERFVNVGSEVQPLWYLRRLQ